MLLSLILPLFLQGPVAHIIPLNQAVVQAGLVHTGIDATPTLPPQPGGNGGRLSITVVNPITLGWQFGGNPLILDVVIEDVGTTYQENFWLQIPIRVRQRFSPVLMVFHKFGGKADDPFANTTFPLECAKRGWFLLSSLGATKKSFSSLESQINRDAIIDQVLAKFKNRIDTKRLYGVGFSMGGGSVLNWAARHQDPNGPRLAAILDHTGGLSLEDVWNHEPIAIRDILTFWFGGSPAAEAFNFQRSSVMSYFSGTTNPDTLKSMGVNLGYVPLGLFNVASDPMGYLVAQTQRFRDMMSAQGGTVVYIQSPGNIHSWSTLDAGLSCDFLGSFSLSTPLAGSTVADRDGRWLWLDVTQEAVGEFTTFDWSINTAGNTLAVTNSTNLQRIGADLDELPLDPSTALQIEVSALALVSNFIDLRGYSAAPTSVTRDGVPTAAWTWNAGTSILSLEEQALGNHVWIVTP